jgi:hypothetical protein
MNNDATRILLIDDADPGRQSVRRVLSETTTAYNVDCVGSYVEVQKPFTPNALALKVREVLETTTVGQ